MMNLHALVVLIVTQVTVLAQKYKKFEVFTAFRNVWLRDISPSERQFLFEVNTCSESDFTLWYSNVRIYYVIMSPKINSLSIDVRKGPINTRFVKTVPLAMCNTFQKFKFIWNQHGNVSMWTTDAPGWRLLFNEKDPNPYLQGFGFLKLWSYSANWKIYQIEHSTEPIRSTCVNV